MLLDGAALAAADPRPWRPRRLRLLKSTMLSLSSVVVVRTDVVVATLLDGAVLVAALARPRLCSKAWKLLSLSSGAVVVVGTDVADTGVMDDVVTVAEVLRPSLKLLSPSNVAGVGSRYGSCGSYAYGQCNACCSKKMATEEEEKK
ncbi:unnamed protein product [Brassica rapa subsp. trilocularis]